MAGQAQAELWQRDYSQQNAGQYRMPGQGKQAELCQGRGKLEFWQGRGSRPNDARAGASPARTLDEGRFLVLCKMLLSRTWT
jgi:hypothetical protein